MRTRFLEMTLAMIRKKRRDRLAAMVKSREMIMKTKVRITQSVTESKEKKSNIAKGFAAGSRRVSKSWVDLPKLLFLASFYLISGLA